MTDNHTTETASSYTEEWLKVSELSIDRRVQRAGLNKLKVERMLANWNPAAIGILTVSRRKDRSIVIIDGQHRWEADRNITDNQGMVKCHVFEGLSLADEADMFLKLNDTSKPTKIDQFKVSLQADGPDGDESRDIQEILGNYGWQVSGVAANGNVAAVQVVQKMYRLSRKLEAEPNLVTATILVISRAWGNERVAAQAPIFEGIAQMFAEYGTNLDLDRLIDVLKSYRGGARSLVAESEQLAKVIRSRQAMAVASILVEAYNKGRRTRQLHSWRKRN